jgi:cytochrome c oxidase assembly protein subunit 15
MTVGAVTDTFPHWRDEMTFERVQEIPEYQKINIQWFQLSISFIWEWFHRFIGRIIGLVLLFLSFIFLAKTRFFNRLKNVILWEWELLKVFLGWFGKKRFNKQSDVSHLDLRTLTFAFITFALYFMGHHADTFTLKEKKHNCSIKISQE